MPGIVRDLTMSLDDKPLYADKCIKTVHDPATNRFIADKSNMFKALPQLHPSTLLIKETDVEMALDLIPGRKIVLKPVTGMQSDGVQVVSKLSDIQLKPGSYLAQEYIDTRGGMPEFGIQGMHNLRVISVGAKAVGAVARLGGSEGDILKDDYYGDFVDPDDLTSEQQHIVHNVHSVLSSKPGRGNNVIAIDIMRGIDASGERRDVLCEVNRRPLRISPWDLRDENNLEPAAITEMTRRWDKAEAAMLADLVE
jgi:glutathione synthase/RimK-type ligase-like ATP-grasp enzyme